MHITRLSAAHAPAYRELMLQAYVQAADAFTSTADERQVQPLSWWADRIAAPTGLSESFGAFEGQELVGTVALEYSAKPKTRHAALVLGMYVRPAVRGHGVGALLMQAAIAAARARPELRSLNLTVTEGNEPAIRLYQSVGFVSWGVEPDAILTPSGFKGKLHMFMELRDTSAGRPLGGEAPQARPLVDLAADESAGPVRGPGNPLVGPELDRAAECEAVLRSLPEWFGIEEALLMYARDTARLPTFAVLREDTVVAFLSLAEHAPQSWEVHCMAVHAKARNLGLGTRLLEHAERWLVSRGARFLQVKTVAHTSPSRAYAETRAFYRARGFTPLEVFPLLWAPQNPALQLVKVLPPLKPCADP